MNLSKQLKILLLQSLVGLSLISGAQAATTTTTYFHTDALGSVVAASDEAGAVLWRKTYDPYGTEITVNQNGAELEEQTYTGKPYDPETGLVYLGQRYYDPQIRRFMGMDPMGFKASNPASFNRYTYANNNPYKFIDPDGRQSVSGFAYAGCIAAGGTDCDGLHRALIAGESKGILTGSLVVGSSAALLLCGSNPVCAAPISTGLFAASGDPIDLIGGGVTKGVKTPYGLANQSADAASLLARSKVLSGATLYRIGTTGKSQAAEAQFWALESPLSKGFAQRYGIPQANVTNANFIETSALKPGSSFITRSAPGVGANNGGGIEVVVSVGGIEMKFFRLGLQ